MNVLETKIKELQKENEQLKRQIKIKDEYNQLIWEIATDYDGYTKAEDLMGLIDDLIDYSSKAIRSDDKSVIYTTFKDGKFYKTNILGEDLGVDYE